jgi:hypothetical protein
MPDPKLGKLPATEDSRDLMFAKYATPAKLPTPPAQFGHETLFGAKDWGCSATTSGATAPGRDRLTRR